MSNFEEYPLDANDVYVNGDPNLRYPQPPPSGGTDLDSLDLSTNESSDDDLFVTKEDGGTAWVKKSFLKIWNYIKTKIGISAQGSTGKYLDEQGNFTTPPNTTYGVVSKTANGLAPHLPDETTTTKYLRQDGMWAVPPDTKKGNGITTYAAKTGSGTTVTSTIVANTTMDNAIGTLLNNDVALKSALITHQAVIFNNLIGFAERNKAVHVFANLTSLDSTKTVIEVQASAPYLPVLSYAILPLYSTTAPYTQIGTIWIYNNGTVKMYKPANVTTGYVSGCYVCQ